MKTSALLQPKAFFYERAEINDAEMKEMLAKLYKSKPAYELTHEFKTESYYSLPLYNIQLNQSIDALCEFILLDHYSIAVQQAVTSIKKKLIHWDIYYQGKNNADQKHYFQTYKKNIETILYLLSQWKRDRDIDRSKFVATLITQLDACSAVMTLLENTIFELSEPSDVSTWLAEFRKNILLDWSQRYHATHMLRDGLNIHVYPLIIKKTQFNGWNIPGANKLVTMKDGYERDLGWTDPQDTLAVEHFFREQYSRTAIIENIVFNINDKLVTYKDAKAIPYDVEHPIIEIFDKFNFDKDFYIELECSGDSSTFCIKQEFWADLPSLTEQFLEQNGYIKRKEGYSQSFFVEQTILTSLQKEKDRLEKKYGAGVNRVVILDQLMNKIRTDISGYKDDQIISKLRIFIEDKLTQHPQLDAYEQQWAKKFGLVLLNLLMAASFIISCTVKYALTRSCFFSLQGKTIDTLKNALTQLEESPHSSVSP